MKHILKTLITEKGHWLILLLVVILTYLFAQNMIEVIILEILTIISIKVGASTVNKSRDKEKKNKKDTE